MSKSTGLKAAILIAALSAPAQAAERAEVMGVGSLTCAEFAQDFKKDVRNEQIFLHGLKVI